MSYLYYSTVNEEWWSGRGFMIFLLRSFWWYI